MYDPAIASLSNSWLSSLRLRRYSAKQRTDDNEKIEQWISARPSDKPCRLMNAAITAASLFFETATGGMHDGLVRHCYSVCALSVENHRGLHTALTTIEGAFFREVVDRRAADTSRGTARTPEQARGEWLRSLHGAMALLLGPDSLVSSATICACWTGPEDSCDPAEYSHTDVGNAEHLLSLAMGSLLWAGVWHVHRDDDGLWDFADGAEVELAKTVGVVLQQRAQELAEFAGDDPAIAKKAKALWSWSNISRSRNSIDSMLKLGRSSPGVTVELTTFNSDPRLLSTGMGKVMELRTDGFVSRFLNLPDRVTFKTNVPYIQDHVDVDWNRYLETFLPDLELRKFVQRLLGYSLLGFNPERLIVFLHGPTSTGKTTLAEVVSETLGPNYSGSFNLTVFRDNADERPRADVFRLVSQRIAFASEGGNEWSLHAEQIKRLTGGDRVSVRRPYDRAHTERIPAVTPYILMNNVPVIPGADAAFKRRLVAVPFDQQVDNKWPLVGQALRTSISARQAVLSWMLQGWANYCDVGLDRETWPQAVLDRTAMITGDLSPFHAWMLECCVTEPSAWGASEDVYSSYKTWCLINGIDPKHTMSKIMLGKKLVSMGIDRKTRRVKGSLIRGWDGLDLK